MSLCAQCVQGVVHEGEAKGELTQAGDTKLYIARAKEGPNDKAILYLSDIFGLDLINNQLIADAYAANGLTTYMPDLFQGDAVPADAMSKGTFDMAAWRPKHGPDAVRPAVDATLSKMKEDGVEKIAAVGYCFGARYVFDYAYDKKIDVAAVCHPSQLKVPEDLEKMKATGLPILFNTCETDNPFPKEAQEAADKIFGDAETYKRNYYAGCSHGFAVRADLKDPVAKKAKEEAFKECYEWFVRHL